MRGIHQVVAGAAPRDAITNHVLAARAVIRAMGVQSEIFAEERHTDGSLRNDVLPHTRWDAVANPNDAAIIHYSIDSPAFTDIAERARTVALHYHNITPPALLWKYSPALARQCAEGRRQLAPLAPCVTHAAADSAFNADELLALGFPDAAVIGILRGQTPTPPSARRGGDRTRLLFVGRGVQNKAQDELILALGSLLQTGADAELHLVGPWGGNRAFETRCRWLARRVDAEDRVIFRGSVSDSGLAAEYANADVFVCLSRHEGYCVPIIEAMQAGLPVVARAAGAVPETAGAGGLVLANPTPSMVAEAISAVLGGALHHEMAEGRRTQLAVHSPEATAARLRAFVETLA